MFLLKADLSHNFLTSGPNSTILEVLVCIDKRNKIKSLWSAVHVVTKRTRREFAKPNTIYGPFFKPNEFRNKIF